MDEIHPSDGLVGVPALFSFFFLSRIVLEIFENLSSDGSMIN